jgi:hypothetical protein
MAITDRDAERLNLTSPAANDIGLGDIIQDLQASSGGTTSVSWANITGKPSTFPPTLGTSGTTALAGNGTAAAATKLATARTISLTGGVTGSASFDGSANVSITATAAAATASVAGVVKQAATQANSTATDVAGVVADLNALIAKLKAAGIMA